MNICVSCSRDFASVRAFDSHRIGSYRGGRWCLSDDELRENGFVQNAYGRWTLDEDATRARRRFSAAGVAQDGQREPNAPSDTAEGRSGDPRTIDDLLHEVEEMA